MAETLPITIDPASGTIRIGDGIALRPGERKGAVSRLLAPWLIGAQDHRNGYAWLYFDGFSFGSEPASLSLCFQDRLLEQANWGVAVPGGPGPGVWPTAEEAQPEVDFVRAELARQTGFDPHREEQKLTWGAVWSGFDPKAGIASHGLRYAPGSVLRGCVPFAAWFGRKN